MFHLVPGVAFGLIQAYRRLRHNVRADAMFLAFQETESLESNEAREDAWQIHIVPTACEDNEYLPQQDL